MPSSAPPPVSVVMPVHNALPYLDLAIESVVGQTYADFEFVILDDGSTDNSRARIEEWAARDSRIRLIAEPVNLGPVLSSERVARAARGAIVVRMDADDISLPSRIAEQVAVFDKHPEVGVVGGLYDIIDASGRAIRGAETARLLQPPSIPPFGNGPLAYRREIFEAVGGYREQCEYWEDHDLINRMAAITSVRIIPHAIYQVRQSPVSTRFASDPSRVERALSLMYRCRERLDRGLPYDDLLDQPAGEAKIDPRVFISLGSIVLWAGGRPRLLGRLLRRGALRPDLRSLSAVVWTAWAFLQPHSLRLFLRLLLNGRQARAAGVVRTEKAMVWTGALAQARREPIASGGASPAPHGTGRAAPGSAAAATSAEPSSAANH